VYFCAVQRRADSIAAPCSASRASPAQAGSRCPAALDLERPPHRVTDHRDPGCDRDGSAPARLGWRPRAVVLRPVVTSRLPGHRRCRVHNDHEARMLARPKGARHLVHVRSGARTPSWIARLPCPPWRFAADDFTPFVSSRLTAASLLAFARTRAGASVLQGCSLDVPCPLLSPRDGRRRLRVIRAVRLLALVIFRAELRAFHQLFAGGAERSVHLRFTPAQRRTQSLTMALGPSERRWGGRPRRRPARRATLVPPRAHAGRPVCLAPRARRHGDIQTESLRRAALAERGMLDRSAITSILIDEHAAGVCARVCLLACAAPRSGVVSFRLPIPTTPAIRLLGRPGVRVETIVSRPSDVSGVEIFYPLTYPRGQR
jgi:hypothetical protein